jgi:excisionase family DNA binding protein
MEIETVVVQGTGVSVPIAPGLLTVHEAARYLGATAWAIRRLIWSGNLPYTQVGKRFNVSREALDEWRKKNERRNGVSKPESATLARSARKAAVRKGVHS